MRFELIGKTKSTVEAINILSEKLGQKDVKPAVCVSFKTSLPNSSLNMLGPTVLPFLYENTGKNTGQLEGIQVVSNLPNLTPAAAMLGALDWDYEQTGCKLTIYQGASGHADIKLKDGEVRKIKTVQNEGGTVDWFWQFYTADVDEDTLGALGVLKSLERDLEVTAPEMISKKQPQLLDEQEPLTPAGALAASVKGDGKADKDSNVAA
jgi:hypothetical protein